MELETVLKTILLDVPVIECFYSDYINLDSTKNYQRKIR